ncbi:hypothetical protein CYY_004786 [Polysphondylium violaceum]|uniref:ERCC1-like central domain-containing protein n=1 Tax=Polysphondylium violaceum TaxID=133409 RepID=A0A8J4PU22_9MYCE|nr:hypothetical protein CYY_004786 [Polysphondylium violaceum]
MSDQQESKDDKPPQVKARKRFAIPTVQQVNQQTTKLDHSFFYEKKKNEEIESTSASIALTQITPISSTPITPITPPTIQTPTVTQSTSTTTITTTTTTTVRDGNENGDLNNNNNTIRPTIGPKKKLTLNIKTSLVGVSPNLANQNTSTTTHGGYQSRVIYINERQKDNLILSQFTSNLKWEIRANQIADFVFSGSSCALYLSLRDYRLNPQTIVTRSASIPSQFELKVLLCQVDVEDCVALIEELVCVAIDINMTLVLSWSSIESARYLESFKTFDSKPPDSIKGKAQPADQGGKTPKEEVLTKIKSVNKTDAATLVSTFGSIQKIFKCDKNTLGKIPGFGPVKINSFLNTIHQPFKTNNNSNSNNNNNPNINKPSPFTLSLKPSITNLQKKQIEKQNDSAKNNQENDNNNNNNNSHNNNNHNNNDNNNIDDGGDGDDLLDFNFDEQDDDNNEKD